MGTIPPPPRYSSFHHVLEQKSKEKLLQYYSSLKQEPWGHSGIFDDDDDDDDFYDDGRKCFRFRRWMHRSIDRIKPLWTKAGELAIGAWEFGRSDKRKVIFAAKMGMALAVMALLVSIRLPFKDLSSHSIWAILTVVVVFEFSIGIRTFSGLK